MKNLLIKMDKDIEKSNQISIIGPQNLIGDVVISGAKNSALKLMAASVLTDDEVVIENVPKIADVFIMVKVLEAIGARVSFECNTVCIKADSITSFEAPFDLVNQMRASILVLGPLLARTGRARVALPGGCKIGMRKIDFHIQGLEKLGADFSLDRGYIEGRCGRLKGNNVSFNFPSVGATENLVMASVLADGMTVIENAAREPEIKDLADFLISMGAKIYNAGSNTITVEGVEKLHGTKYSVMPDRIESGSFAFGAAISGGDVTLKKSSEKDLKIVLEQLRQTGTQVEIKNEEINIKGTKIRSRDFITLPYPGFPTDLQAPAMALMSLSDDTSIITENVFENRFTTALELKGMGANIKIQDHHAVIKGVKNLYGHDLKVPDLRGGAALVMAALAAHGESHISDIFHINRGYEDFFGKLKNLGAKITENG